MVDVAVEAPPATKETVVLFAGAEPLSAPVMVAVPTLVEETSVAVEVPFESVALVPAATEPPPVLDQVTVRPALATELLFASASCAAIVTVDPTVGLYELDVTRYFVGAPATNETPALLVIAEPFTVPLTAAYPTVAD